jgi:D-3-phosphoglycerate dehydrogenase
MAKLLVCDSISAIAVEEMRALGVTVDVRDTITPEELTAVIGDYDAIVVRSRTKVRAPMLENPGNLKYIIRGGVGVDNIDVEVAKAKGIKVLNTPAATSNSVAELALGLMFALARRIAYADATMKAGQWEKKTLKGLELAGKTLGVIGYGRIGKLLGQKARALGMKVVAYDPYVQDEDIVPLEELLKQADYISLHLPHTDETHDLLSADQFAMMKPGVFIVDAARGGVVDEKRSTMRWLKGVSRVLRWTSTPKSRPRRSCCTILSRCLRWLPCLTLAHRPKKGRTHWRRGRCSGEGISAVKQPVSSKRPTRKQHASE